MSELTFISENPEYVDGKLNIEKYKRVFEVISEIQSYQDVSYEVKPNPQIINSLIEFPHLSDSDLYNLSLIREPRGATLTDVEA